MTRDEILAEYQVSYPRGGPPMITSPGKFEGEAIWAPYFYERMGYTDEWLGVLPEDHEMFPELKGEKFIKITEDENGFVYCHTK